MKNRYINILAFALCVAVHGQEVRHLQYTPDGEDFVCINGENRYTRALYGSPTAWRLETSDRPIFATYAKGDSRNIRFRLLLPSGSVTPLEETTWCEARYTPGRRSYTLKDDAWGTDAMLRMAVVCSPTDEEAIWEFCAEGLPEGCTLEAIDSPIRVKKLSRSGDMGADPKGVFDPAEAPLTPPKGTAPLTPPKGGTPNADIVRYELDSILYIRYNRHFISPPLGGSEGGYEEDFFARYEAARRELASRICINTPDPYLNTLGGALAVAADGIWGTEGVWLHGAVGWRMPLSGWRAAYTGDALGWHDRARTHFENYAASQVTDIPCTHPHPAQDSALALARAVKEWGTPMYSNGYICRNPQRNNQMHHYDMNLCYIDELLWHLNWTGDLAYARKMWPLLTLHLAWEKRNFDPDNDGLYDAYACIWASDALYYNSGAVTHSTAYNYRANRMAAMIAEKIGEDPAPYREEADRILAALNSRLWLPDKGHWAEFQDLMGHKRLHESAAVWTIYHAIDSNVADPFQAYLATRYVDREIPHIPIVTDNADINAGNYATISTTNWMPYSWSINNVAFAEVMHTALAYFQAGRADAGYKLLKSSILDGMYLGSSPGNFGQISHYDAARGECYRDFGDPIGVASRVLIQGLFGILPDALNGRLLIRPAFPSDWEFAELHTPDIDLKYNVPMCKYAKVQIDSNHIDTLTTYEFTHRLPAVHIVELQFPARYTQVARLTVNGKPVDWKLMAPSVGCPMLSATLPASADKTYNIGIEWSGERIVSQSLDNTSSIMTSQPHSGFTLVEQGDMKWWVENDNVPMCQYAEVPIDSNHIDTLVAHSRIDTLNIGTLAHLHIDTLGIGTSAHWHIDTLGIGTSAHWHIDTLGIGSLAHRHIGTLDIGTLAHRHIGTLDIDTLFNARVTDIFRNQYLSPRSPYTTLQIPTQGIGEWCHPALTAEIDDSGLRAAVKDGVLETKLGIPFRTPAEGKNIVFTSLWDNYPDSVSIPLKGKASCAYLLMAGSTNHMQCHIENGIVRIYYKDGTCDTLPLVNPDNWPPIEQIFFEDGKAFNRHAPSLYRLSLKTAELSNNFAEELGLTGINRTIEGGAAVLLQMPLNKKKPLSRLVIETLSNEVVIGLMAVSLQR